MLKNTLGALKVKCDFVELEAHPTITKLRVMSRGQLIRLDFEDRFENTDPELVLSRMEQASSMYVRSSYLIMRKVL